jgi:hypothetical protein
MMRSGVQFPVVARNFNQLRPNTYICFFAARAFGGTPEWASMRTAPKAIDGMGELLQEIEPVRGANQNFEKTRPN